MLTIEKLFHACRSQATEAAIEVAAKQLRVATESIVASEFRRVPDEYEKAVTLAQATGDITVEQEARAEAARAYLECYTVASPDERSRFASLYADHIRALEALGFDPARLAIERSHRALLEEDGAGALRYAEEGLRGSEKGSDVWVDAALCCIKAYWALDRPQDALPVVDLLSTTRGSDRSYGTEFAIWATSLEALRRSGQATTKEVEAFCRNVRDLVANRGMPAKRATLALGSIVEQFNQPASQSALLTLLECAAELAEEAGEPPLCCTTALQAAEVAGLCADEPKARLLLGKANLWVEKSRASKATWDFDGPGWPTLRVNWLSGKGRTLARLSAAAPISGSGREESLLLEAFDSFREAAAFLADHRDELRGEVDLFIADLNVWLGDSAADLNRGTEAAGFLRRARSETARANSGFWNHRALPAWLRESESLALSGRLDDASEVVDELIADAGDDAVGGRAHQFRSHLSNRLVPTRDWFTSPEALAIAKLAREKSLREAVGHQVSSLVTWWDEFPGPEAELFDWWGRGGFSRVAAAIRARPHGAIAVDARSVSEIEQWARILCPLFDTVIVKWKGEIGAGMLVAPVPDDYGGPGAFGGHGYTMTSSEVRPRNQPQRRGWHVQVTWGNPLPHEVAAFLASEARTLLAAGRLVVLPAPLVGCTQTAVGWTDNLLVEGLLGGVVNVAQQQSDDSTASGGQRILDLSRNSVPYIADISLPDLAKVLDETDEWVSGLRSLLDRSLLNDGLRVENWASIRALENDIRDSCRELEAKFEVLAGKRHWRIAHAAWRISAALRIPLGLGTEPVTGLLRAVASERPELTPWIPYWRLTSLGGHLAWKWPLDNPSTPPMESRLPRAVHSWLYPGTAGWGWRPVIVPA